MQIVKADVEYVSGTATGKEAMLLLERVARTCYKSEDKICEGSDERLIHNLLARKHDAMLEHISYTLRFICDRGVSHEIVRHRIASYAQESTRYCNYGNKEIEFIDPSDAFGWDMGDIFYNTWYTAMFQSEAAYKKMLEHGCKPEEARSVLPNSLKTEIVVTMNVREWRHFIELRCAPTAHPQMREVANKALDILYHALPICFEAFK